jgi:hypothetical protein
MRRAILILTVLLFSPALRAQENTFRLTVLGHQWTTTHKTLTFSWPGYANTSCNGRSNMSGYISSTGNISANGTTSDTCSTTYTPPTNQNIDIQKAVVFIQAETESSRMLLTCTRNVRWSQCHALNPGQFLARIDNGHFEVKALFGKGKEEWVKFDVVQQTAISRQQPQSVSVQAVPVQSAPVQEAAASIEAPKSQGSDTNSEFPSRWKSMTTGAVRTLRFEKDYIYAETILPETAVKAGAFILMEVKKDGEKYTGKTNARLVRTGGGAFCSVTLPYELTLVTPDRIEGRSFSPPRNAKIDWNTCSYSAAQEWQPFVWIPVK